MTYSPKYTSQAKVAGVTQFTASGSTTPTETQILQWIQEIETDVDVRGLASNTLTDNKIDVQPTLDLPAKNTIAWLEAISGQRFEEISASLFVPPFIPVVSITHLYRRTSDLTETEVWEELTEGPGSDKDFILLKRRTKTGQYLGFCIYFYQDPPDPGYQRIKMTYVWGWNLSTDIIGEWCSLKVALKTLDALVNANTPFGASDYSISDLRVGINTSNRLKEIKERLLEIENLYFPDKQLGLAFV